jgi:hypothetical protein
MALEKEDIMALIAILQKGLENESESAEENMVTQKSPKQRKPRKTKSEKPKENVRENKFDKMSERNMHKQDTLIDKKLWHNLAASDRTRHYNPVMVKCRSCGKTETVNPVLVESVERYKCNKCSSSPG